MEFGSLINLAANSTIVPKIGMGATVCYWTDRKAGTIIKVTPKSIDVQIDESIRIDSNGMSDDQEYQYIPSTQGAVISFRLNKQGQYRHSKSGLKAVVGVRDTYYDFSF